MNAKDYLAHLHTLPCVVTFLLLGERVKSEVVHHPESVRDELSHYAGIPMTDDWHKTLHRESRRGFERMTKLTPIDLLAGTIKLLMEAK